MAVSRHPLSRWALGFSAVLVFSFARRTVAATQAPASQPSAPPAPAVGDVIPAFQAVGVNGETRQFTFPKGSHTVLLFFVTSCPHCHRMFPEWNRRYNEKAKGLDVYGIMMDREQEPPWFFSSVSIQFPVYRRPSTEFLEKIKVLRAPATIRVGAGGKIEDVELGEVHDPIRLGELFTP